MNADCVAIVGMAGRFPGAPDIRQFWENTLVGKTCIAQVDAGLGEVGARGALDDPGHFDAAFFGVSPYEAALLDQQHRVFLELCWHALEDAGMDPYRTSESISVFASCTPPLGGVTDQRLSVAEQYQQMIATSPDFLPTRVSYKLGLRGESVLVQTACSSSLVAVHLACESLLSGRSDVALAGGVSIAPDQLHGYPYQEGMISSPTGECRPFDERANGTVPGSGAGVVVLRPLEDALRDRDFVYAVILGSAVNNDGASKVGFMAPSVEGQCEVISTALGVARVSPDSIGMLEAHGTATRLGDQVEIEALRKAFGVGSAAGACALSSLKGSVGHLDRAAGVSGLIRAALCLSHATIPKAPGSEVPQHDLHLDSSPFYFPQETEIWVQGTTPRRAGVSSFGVGGTNAHVVLEEAPRTEEITPQAPQQEIIPLSARSQLSFSRLREELASYLDTHPDVPIGDVARARSLERAELELRATVVGDTAGAVALAVREDLVVETAARRRIVFGFPGHGMKPPRGGTRLYQRFPAYRQAIDECTRHLKDILDVDMAELLHNPPLAQLPDPLEQMRLAQPALLTLEYALARLWQSWGVTPDAVLGHSMGEIAAACAAGVFRIEEALELVAARGRLLEVHAPGAMTLVHLTEEEVAELLPSDLDIAAINGPAMTVVSGASDPVSRFEQQLTGQKIPFRRLQIDCAAHSRLVEPGLAELGDLVKKMVLESPLIPIAGNSSGDWLTGDDIKSTSHWVDHFRQTVRFWPALERAVEGDNAILIEMGPGQALCRLSEQGGLAERVVAVPSDPFGEIDDVAILAALGKVWCYGASVDWKAVHGGTRAKRVRLPGYPFDHSTSWEAPRFEESVGRGAEGPLPGPEGWLFERKWARIPALGRENRGVRSVVVVGNSQLSKLAFDRFREAGLSVSASPSIEGAGNDITDIVDFTMAETHEGSWGGASTAAEGILAVAVGNVRRLVEQFAQPVRYWCVTDRRQPLRGEQPDPAFSVISGIGSTVGQEHPNVDWTWVDLPRGDEKKELLSALVDDVLNGPVSSDIALRDDGRWVQQFEVASPSLIPRPVRDGGVYLVTGGAGRVGLALAEAIAAMADGVHLVLMSRHASTSIKNPGVSDALQRISSFGASFELADVDVAHEQSLLQNLDDLRQRRGGLSGVVHAAGFTDRARFPLLMDATPQDIAEIFRAKVRGTVALANALQREEPDFVVLCSSLSTVIGGIRHGVYIAANAFLDSFATQLHELGLKAWISVAWEAWLPEESDASSHAVVQDFALSSEEGIAIFQRLLAMPGPTLVISKMHPEARVRLVARTLSEEGAAIVSLDGGSATSMLDDPNFVGQTVRRCIAQTIGANTVDDNQDLRTMGADSLRLLQLLGALNRELRIGLRPSQIFHKPSVRRIIDMSIDALKGAERSLGGGLDHAPESDEYPTTALQRRWLKMAALGFGYIDVCVRFSSPVDLQRLSEALESVMARHSALRTRFASDHDSVTQLVSAYLPPVQLETLPADEDGAEEALRSIVRNVSANPFDFATEVPFLPTLIEVADGSVLLYLHVHHVAFDGTSSTIFLRDLAQEYIRGDRFLSQPFQYVDYATWHEGYRLGPRIERARKYWCEMFDGAPGALTITPDLPGPHDDSIGEMVRFTIDRARRRHLHAVAQSLDTSPFALFMAAFLLFLREETGKTDLIIGTTSAGRNVVGTEEIIGVFVNPLPMRFRADSGDDVALIRHVARRLVEFQEFQEYWLEDMIHDVPIFEGVGLNDTFRCYILLQNYERPTDLAGLQSEVVPLLGSPHHELMRDVELVIDEQADGGWLCELWYRRAMYSRGRVQQWAEMLDSSLTRLAQLDDASAKLR